MKKQCREFLKKTPVFPIARDFYQAVFNPKVLAIRRARKRLFSQFVAPGDLVFDVGANIGEFSEVFLSLGAKVVSFEPNPRIIPQLLATCARYGAVVEEVAVGPMSGWAELNVTDWHALSTLSQEWKAVSKARYGTEWSEQFRVPVVTLDAMAAKHGQPAFIKIDVEGYEARVLSGLSRVPRYLSFEFHREYLHATLECLSMRCMRDGAAFNYSLKESPTLELGTWVSREELVSRLEDLPEVKQSYGDVFVRFEETSDDVGMPAA